MTDMKSVGIRSAKDGTELIISADNWPDSDTISVSIASPSLSASMATSTYFVGSPALLFERMAANWRGWEGEYHWATLEDDFRLTATADKLGHIELVADLKSDSSPPDWQARVRLTLEAGGLEQLFQKVHAAFPIHQGAPRNWKI